MSNSSPIGIFDSGIGGLTVVKAVARMFPNENIVYFGDTARVPYGPKSPQVVREYAVQATEFLLKFDVKMIVVACNTVSAVALDAVQKHARVPVIGVIQPGAEAAVRASVKKRIGVIGTVGTIRSDAYANAIRLLDPSVTVFSRPCPLFVPLVEEGWLEHKATEMIAKEYLFPLTLERIDTLVLGCTHYPLLKKAIHAATNQSLELIDSGEATADAVGRELVLRGIGNDSPMRANLQFHVSDVPYRFSEIGERFLGQRLGKVHRVPGFTA